MDPRQHDLLIVGGLTVDRFPDGREAPGGSVLHAGEAAVAAGAALAVLTVCDDEPAARTGLERLATLGTLSRQSAGASVTYRHEEEGGRRVLIYDAATDPITAATVAEAPPADVVLVAPIADEVPLETLRAVRSTMRGQRAVLLIQGWLRRLEVGVAVHPLALDELPAELWRELGTADAVALSTEDLAEAPGNPFAQAADLRARIGSRPLLVVTLGVDGYLLDDPLADRVVASVPRRIITGVSTLGAGDAFGAAFALHLARAEGPMAAADAAGERVIAMLEARRATPVS